MKNLFAIAFSCVYLTLAVGVAKTTHYCMGRENHTAHFSFTADPCPCFKLLGEESDCCSDESILLQVDDEQAASAQLVVAPVSLPLIYEFDFLIADEAGQSFNNEFFAEKFLRPPVGKAYIKHHSLII